jgi:2-polyprenyl-3-methyl-5-hydroxy-6-metoxy-1,4-benzoquinol methylase
MEIVERVDPSLPRNQSRYQLNLHRERYYFAKANLSLGMILDAGCGVGYGTLILAHDWWWRTFGVDLDKGAILKATTDYNHWAATYLAGNLETFWLPYRFGTVVCLETLEHLDDADMALANLKRHLVPRGVLIASTPLNEEPGKNRFHKRLWSQEEFIAWVMSAGFSEPKAELAQPDNWTGVFSRSN